MTPAADQRGKIHALEARIAGLESALEVMTARCGTLEDRNARQATMLAAMVSLLDAAEAHRDRDAGYRP